LFYRSRRSPLEKSRQTFSLRANTCVRYDRHSSAASVAASATISWKEILMTKWMAVLAVTALLSVGCDMNKNKSDDMSGDQPKKMSTDACTHCAGNQTAKADGTCPQCGRK